MSTIEPTYADPKEDLTVELVQKPVGNTYDPPQGSDWWECPLCDNSASLDGLRHHLGRDHNFRMVGVQVTVRLGQLYDENGQVIRYVPEVLAPGTED